MSLSPTPGSSATSTTPTDYLSMLGGLSPLPFDPNTVVNGLLAADNQQVTNLQNNIKSIQADETSYKVIGQDVAALQSAAFNLTLQSSVQANAVTSSNTGAVTAAADPTALPGSYTVAVNALATTTTAGTTNAATGNGLGPAVDANNTPLQSLNLSAAPTAGSFSIMVDGQIETVNVDPTKALLDPSGGALYNLQSQINAALTAEGDGAHATVGVVGNKVQIGISGGATAHSISFGAAGDSSNFLTLMNLSGVGGQQAVQSGSPQALTLSSTAVVGVSAANNPTNLLSGLHLATTLQGSGDFKINGVDITYNASQDHLSDVIQRINSSSAGVVAQYDSVNDRLVLTSKTTGRTAISLSDVNGNFLGATGLLQTGAQSLGSNAQVTINGAAFYSTGNTISNAIPGLTINALAQTGSTPATLTVAPDVTGITAKVQAFVTAANKVLGDINITQQKDPTSGQYSDLLGDPALVGLKNSIIQMTTSAVLNSGPYESLQDVGLTTGPVGSQPGTTTSFTLDTTKLAAALTANPTLVANLFMGTPSTAGFTGVMQQLNTYLTQQTNPVNGVFAQFQSTGDAQIQQLQNEITQQNNLIAEKRQTLLGQFNAMSSVLLQLSSESSMFNFMNSSSSSSTSSSSSSGSSSSGL